MRHKQKKDKLNMERDHRGLLLRNLATSIILFEKVKTTRARAKQVQPIVEDLISTAKEKDTVAAIRKLNKIILDKKAGKKLLEVLKERYKDQKGGYTRIVKLGHRAGDSAEMVQISLV
ncbi:50S ribosomal protein L17 [Patescibacteria group bacterium]|nr:50S ribosomal protein L17 [Patescibacteria group bacterium]